MIGVVQQFLTKFYKKLPVLAFDILAIPVAWYFAFWFRYNMQPFPHHLFAWESLIAVFGLVAIQTCCYYYFKVYRGLWQFSSVDDVLKIIKSVSVTLLIALPLFYLLAILHQIPRSIMPLYAINCVALLCGARLLMRRYSSMGNNTAIISNLQRVFIIGAGQAGESLVRDLKRASSFFPVGFIDDNPRRQGTEIHGVRVLGVCQDIIHLVVRYKIDLIFIAIPSARSVDMRRIVNFCEQTRVPFRTLPTLKDLASGHIEINALREVNLEDLLGRDEVFLDWTKIAASIHGSSVLITGGGGSIGTELCRQVLALGPEKLMVIDSSEYNLYQIELELREKYPAVPMDFVLASVTDNTMMMRCFSQFKPRLVFHAAAYKHVPLLESQIRIAVMNNVLGTQIVAEAAIKAGVEKFILISTDKAVNPTNIMGTTKRVAEIFCQNRNELVETAFIIVRFGNVLGSTGSVVPLFKKQLQAGGPLTVTHPEVSRYFMTIPEACQLILQATVNGCGGEIFVLDMGVPIKISYLAEQLIRLAGKNPGQDVAICYTGLRPGEKLHEELFHEAEVLTATEHEKLFKAAFRRLDWKELMLAMIAIEDACITHDLVAIKNLLRTLVPEYNDSGTEKSYASTEKQSTLLPV